MCSFWPIGCQGLASDSLFICCSRSLVALFEPALTPVSSLCRAQSTAIQLLERLYDPAASSGTVLLDGVDVRTLNVRWLRSTIGYVSQMPTLFSLSIRDNIALGAGVTVRVDPVSGRRTIDAATVTEADVIEAAKTANAHGFISRLPDGYDTMLGARGTLLSGGQKQRVALARALVRRPSILLLDEATSALDSASERAVQVGLLRAAHGRTTVAIAHRLSTICDADVIAVMGEGGRVTERGTHAQLMALPGGTYHHLVELQSVVKETMAQRAARKAARAAAIDGSGGDAEDGSSSMVVDTPTEDDEAVASVGAAAVSPSEDAADVPLPVDKGVFFRAVRANAREWPNILLGSASAFLAGAAWPVFAVVMTKLLLLLSDSSQDADDDVNVYCIAIVVLSACQALANWGQIALLGLSGEELTYKLRARSFRKMLRFEMAYFDEPAHSVGALGVRLATESTKVRGLTGDAAGTLLMTLGAVGVGIALSMVGCWRVALSVLALMPAVALNGYLEVVVMSGTDAKSAAWFARAGRVASEAVDNIRAVTTLGAERFFLNKYNAGTGVVCGSRAGCCLRAAIALFDVGVARLPQRSVRGWPSRSGALLLDP